MSNNAKQQTRTKKRMRAGDHYRGRRELPIVVIIANGNADFTP